MNKTNNQITTFFTLILVSAVLLLNSQVFAVANNPSKTTFNFADIPKNGKLYLMVVKNETAFKEDKPKITDIVFQAILEVADKSISINADGLPAGIYAAKFFLDTNDNGVLDTNAVGIPKEPYGFSNNKKGLFGPPDFKEVTFTVEPGKKVEQNAKFF